VEQELGQWMEHKERDLQEELRKVDDQYISSKDMS
jgi:hypothetical protein